jgi:hypothetical protein
MVAYVKHNEHFILLDYSIEKLRGSGILKMLQENVFPIKNDDPELPRTQATPQDILPILIILLVSLLASVLCLLTEIAFYRLKNHIRKQSVKRHFRS